MTRPSLATVARAIACVALGSTLGTVALQHAYNRGLASGVDMDDRALALRIEAGYEPEPASDLRAQAMSINRVCATTCPHGGRVLVYDDDAWCRCEEYGFPLAELGVSGPHPKQSDYADFWAYGDAMVAHYEPACEERCPGDGAITVNDECRCEAFRRELPNESPPENPEHLGIREIREYGDCVRVVAGRPDTEAKCYTITDVSGLLADWCEWPRRETTTRVARQYTSEPL